jgi:formylglycine-generating enzyme required for sulfatase activity
MSNVVVAFAVLCVALAGCGENALQPDLEISATTVDALPQAGGSFRVAVRIPKIVAVSVARVEYVITASDMNDVSADLTIADDVASGTAHNVSAGTDRLVTLNAYDAAAEMTYSGSETTDVLAGQTVSVSIVMRAVTPTEGAIEITGTFETAGELTVGLPGGATMEFVWIEPGTFTMGSPESEPDRDTNEGPQHEVTISQGFYLGKTEITQGQWESVMQTTPWVGQNSVQEGAANAASWISWDDFQGLVSALNEAAGSDVYRLPSEAEWEYSCRRGTSTRWSFGEVVADLGDHAWYVENASRVGEDYAHQVGTKLRNGWGLYDMHGNVYEWCQDWYDASYYGSSPSVDPTGASSGSYRVLRGGSFGNSARYARSADRGNIAPGDRDSNWGARLLRTE